MKVRIMNNNRLKRHWSKNFWQFGRAAHTGEKYWRIGLFGYVLTVKHGGILNL